MKLRTIGAVAALVLMAAVSPSALATDCTTDRCRQCQAKSVPNLANKGTCVQCEAVTDPTVRQACYDCIESSVPSDPAQCVLCTTNAEIVSPAARVTCMDCMRRSVPDDSQKKQCLICGNVADDFGRQRCYDCIERSVPGSTDKGLCYHCAFANDVNACFNCLETGTQPIKNNCVTKWHFNWVVGRIGDTIITAKCGDLVEFNNPGQVRNGVAINHNLIRVPGLTNCPSTDPDTLNNAAELVQPAPAFYQSDVITLDKAAVAVVNGAPAPVIFYECDVGANYALNPPRAGHCTTPGGNMQVTVTLTGC